LADRFAGLPPWAKFCRPPGLTLCDRLPSAVPPGPTKAPRDPSAVFLQVFILNGFKFEIIVCAHYAWVVRGRVCGRKWLVDRRRRWHCLARCQLAGSSGNLRVRGRIYRGCGLRCAERVALVGLQRKIWPRTGGRKLRRDPSLNIFMRQKRRDCHAFLPLDNPIIGLLNPLTYLDVGRRHRMDSVKRRKRILLVAFRRKKNEGMEKLDWRAFLRCSYAMLP
jgi:hypothetical protein